MEEENKKNVGLTSLKSKSKKEQDLPQNNEEKYKHFFELAPLAYQSLNEKGYIIEVNPAWLDDLGYSYDEVIGRWFGDFLTQEFIDYFKENFPKFKKAGEIHNVEFEMIKKDGSHIIVSYDGRIAYDEQGNFKQTHCIFKNITERRQTEEELKNALSEWEVTFNASKDSTMLIDDKFKIFKANLATERFLGKHLNELLGKTCYELVHGIDKPPDTCPLKTAKNTKKHAEIELFVPEKNVWLSVTVDPILDDKGNLTCAVHIIKDITERKKIEEELKRSEKQASAAIEAARGFTFSYDIATGKVNWGGAIEEITGYTHKEFANVDIDGWAELIHPDDRDEILSILDEAINKKDRATAEYRFKTKRGDYVILSSISLTEKEKGKPVRLVGILQDITKRKQTEETIKRQNIQLKKLDKIKSDFLNVTSHELRTPMSAIKGYLQMLLNQSLGEISDEQKKGLEVILRNANRLDNLVQDILDVSRLESGTMKFVIEKTYIQKMIVEVTETMQSSAGIKDIRINMEVEEKLPGLNIDQARIKQVIINLVNNSIKFSPDGSIINIRAKKEEGNILFEVQDFGRGIPKNKQKKIFETFYQVDSGKNTKFGGAGLGLAISRGIILAHSGKIWVKSKEGKGSTFSFTLPLKPVKDVEERFKEVDMFLLEEEEGNKND